MHYRRQSAKRLKEGFRASERAGWHARTLIASTTAWPPSSSSSSLMGTLEPLGNGTPNLLPSLPPSPSEEDLTKADGIWNDEPEPAAKWKGKARELSEVSESAPFSAEEEDPLGSAASEAYPPMNDEDAETRRVEEVRSTSSLRLSPHLNRHDHPRRLCDAGKSQSDSAGRPHVCRRPAPATARPAQARSSATRRGVRPCSGPCGAPIDRCPAAAARTHHSTGAPRYPRTVSGSTTSTTRARRPPRKYTRQRRHRESCRLRAVRRIRSRRSTTRSRRRRAR